MKLDLAKWNAERKKIEAEIKALKHGIRFEDKPITKLQQTGINEYGHPKYERVPSGKTYRGATYEEADDLLKLKKKATQLYSLRAALRNKVHGSIAKEEALAILPTYAIAQPS